MGGVQFAGSKQTLQDFEPGVTEENDVWRKATQCPLLGVIRKVRKGSLDSYVILQVPR